MYYNNSSKVCENYIFLKGGKVVVRKMKILVVLGMMLMMGFFTGSLYANEFDEPHNIEAKTVEKDGKNVEYLVSTNDDGYLRITQIIQNSQNVKINTSTYDSKLLLSGKVNKETTLTIKIFNEAKEEEAQIYELTVGATETFSQAAEVREGDNTIVIHYVNKKDGIEDYVTFHVSRESTENMKAIQSYLAIPSI